ncbi:MAG: DNRLRE domain-containing protein [Gammaproteobacteria bacterium]
MSRRIRRFSAFLFLLVLGLAPPLASAALIDLEATADTAISSDNPTTNYGAGATMLVMENWKDGRALMRWDLPGALDGGAVQSATLKMYVRYLNFPDTYAANTQLGVALVDEDWTEGGATWNTSDGVNAWSSTALSHLMSDPGNVYATFDSIPYVDETASEDRTISIDVTSLVQEWADGTDNHGLMLFATNGSVNTFFSSETAGGAPLLSVEYSEAAAVPLAGTGLLALAGGLVMRRALCRRRQDLVW